MPSTAVNNVDRISPREMNVQNPCPPLMVSATEPFIATVFARAVNTESTRCDFQLQTDRPTKAFERGLISYCLATYTPERVDYVKATLASYATVCC
jgi:hypothetical protein